MTFYLISQDGWHYVMSQSGWPCIVIETRDIDCGLVIIPKSMENKYLNPGYILLYTVVLKHLKSFILMDLELRSESRSSLSVSTITQGQIVLGNYKRLGKFGKLWEINHKTIAGIVTWSRYFRVPFNIYNHEAYDG